MPLGVIPFSEVVDDKVMEIYNVFNSTVGLSVNSSISKTVSACECKIISTESGYDNSFWEDCLEVAKNLTMEDVEKILKVN